MPQPTAFCNQRAIAADTATEELAVILNRKREPRLGAGSSRQAQSPKVISEVPSQITRNPDVPDRQQASDLARVLRQFTYYPRG